jgi:hypothetical protein
MKNEATRVDTGSVRIEVEHLPTGMQRVSVWGRRDGSQHDVTRGDLPQYLKRNLGPESQESAREQAPELFGWAECARP